MDAAELVVRYDLGRERWYRPTLEEMATQAALDSWLQEFQWVSFQAGFVGTVVDWNSDGPVWTSREDLRAWFEAAPEGATHMVVALDEIDGGCFPIYVGQGEDARRRAKQENDKPLQRVMEVYRLDYSFEKQVSQHRCFTYDHPELEKDGGANGPSPIDATLAREQGPAASSPSVPDAPPSTSRSDSNEREEVDYSGCPAIGVGGLHSDHYGNPDDGVCQWCGMKSRLSTPNAPPSTFAEPSVSSQCSEHGAMLEPWIVCVHTAAITAARIVMDGPVVIGEAVCPECRHALERGKPPHASLRIACAACVKARWPLSPSTLDLVFPDV